MIRDLPLIDLLSGRFESLKPSGNGTGVWILSPPAMRRSRERAQTGLAELSWRYRSSGTTNAHIKLHRSASTGLRSWVQPASKSRNTYSSLASEYLASVQVYDSWKAPIALLTSVGASIE